MGGLRRNMGEIELTNGQVFQFDDRCIQYCPYLAGRRDGTLSDNERIATYQVAALGAFAEYAMYCKGPWDSADRTPGPYWECSAATADAPKNEE
jgi:hypothetical protein